MIVCYISNHNIVPTGVDKIGLETQFLPQERGILL